MIELFVRRPAMTLMFVLVFVVLGIVSYNNLIIESTPKITFPLVSIKTVYPGASPVEIETQIIKKIEDAIAEISEIKKIHSTAYENFGFVMIEFDISSDVNIKSIEVKDKVEAILNNLPQGAKKPEIAKFDPMVKPILDLVLLSSSMNDRDLYEYADKKLKNRLSVIEGVASVDLYGGKHRQINVNLDGTLMKKYFIAIDDVIGAISSRNINIPGGSIEKMNDKISVRFIGEFEDIDQLRNMVLVSKEGTELKLSDIATVEDSYKDVETVTHYNGQNTVGIAIKKLSDGDAVTIAKKVKKALIDIKKDLPEGCRLVTAFDSTDIIVSDTVSTVWNIVFGIILTVIILFIFLGDITTTVIASIVIPTSIISTFLLMDYSRFTINMMTLLAIGTALGTLIANALVVIESIMYKIEHGMDRIKASIEGTREVLIAVIGSAGTNVVVFTPIAFMGGIVGQFMKQFGLTVVYATIFSILASFTLTPMLCAVMLRKDNIPNKETRGRRLARWFLSVSNSFMDKLVKEYKKLFDFMLAHRLMTVMASVLLLVSLAYPMKYMGSEFFPRSDMNLLVATITTPQGSTLDKTVAVTNEIEKLIKAIPEVRDYITYIGIDGPENAKITANLVPLAERKRTYRDMIDKLIPEAAKIPEAEISFSNGDDEGGEKGDIQINVYGIDYNRMVEISKNMMKKMEETGFFLSVESSFKNPKNEIQFIPDNNKMRALSVKNAEVGASLRSSINGNDDNIYKENGEEYKINVELSEFYKKNIDDVKNISIMSKDGLIPISYLGTLKETKAMPSIKRRDKKRVIQIYGYLSKSTAGEVQQILDKKFSKMGFPEGYGYRYVGNAEFFEETAAEILKALIIAIVLTYMLLVATLDSFMVPFVISTTVLTSFIGVFYFLFFCEFSINIGSMMAMVMVVGLAVNNAILMIDYAMQKMRDGMKFRAALWEGAAVKFRAIVMTSIAIIVGALPQIFDPFGAKASMGGVLVGGMIGSIVFTFVTIPPLYDLLMNRRRD